MKHSILSITFQKKDTYISLRHTDINFTELTNVKKVIILNNDPFYCFGTKLKDLPNPFDLYINGYFTSLEEYPNIKELYICEVYDTDTSDLSSSNNPHQLATTHITKVHYANWNKLWTSSNRFSDNEITNADGVAITVDFLSEEELGFSKEFFYPFENFISTKSYLGATAYPFYYGRLTKLLPQNIVYKIDSISNKVKTFILPEDINLTNYGTFDIHTLVVDQPNFNLNSMLNANIPNLVIRNHTNDFTFTKILNAKNIWFIPKNEPTPLTTTGYNES